MRYAAIVVCSAVALIGCQAADDPSKGRGDPQESSSPAAQPSMPEQVLPQTLAKLTYFESRAFDSELSDAMRNQASEIEVTVASPFTLNTVPERLDRWLYSVKKGGGRVVAEALPPKNVQVATRSVLPLLIELVVPLFEMMFDTDIHAYARGYEAKLLYAPEDSHVQKVIFTRVKKA